MAKRPPVLIFEGLAMTLKNTIKVKVLPDYIGYIYALHLFLLHEVATVPLF